MLYLSGLSVCSYTLLYITWIMDKEERQVEKPTPMWFKIVSVATALPGLLSPIWLWSRDTVAVEIMARSTEGWLAMIFPVYALVSAVFSWKSYSQRREVAWILQLLLCMAYGAFCIS